MLVIDAPVDHVTRESYAESRLQSRTVSDIIAHSSLTNCKYFQIVHLTNTVMKHLTKWLRVAVAPSAPAGVYNTQVHHGAGLFWFCFDGSRQGAPSV